MNSSAATLCLAAASSAESTYASKDIQVPEIISGTPSATWSGKDFFFDNGSAKSNTAHQQI